MRVLFFGTADFAVPALEALAESERHEVIAVVTQPDKPQGRGLKLSYSPVKHAALRLGFPILQPRRVRAESFLKETRAMNPDSLALAAFGQIIPLALLDLPPKGPVNVHGSLLPKYRGAAPIQHAILNGESVTGITTMWMDATLDTGDILLQREVPISEDDTTGTLVPKLAEAGAELLLKTLDRLADGTCPRIPQNNADATYAPAITPADMALEWSEPKHRIRNRVRALSPRPGAFAFHARRRIKVWECRVKGASRDYAAGSIVEVGREFVAVATGDGLLELVEVQPENSRRMSAGEWARGARLKPGDSFDREV
jgi:methionyl-tRNA formyltransferase